MAVFKMLNFLRLFVVFIILTFLLSGCSESGSVSPSSPSSPLPVNPQLQKEAELFLKVYFSRCDKIERVLLSAIWNSSINGKKEEFEAMEGAETKYAQLHGDKELFNKLKGFLARKDLLEPLTARCLVVAEPTFLSNQYPAEIQALIYKKAGEVQLASSSFQCTVDGKKYSAITLLDLLKKETDSTKRKKIWVALKEVGTAVGPGLVELVKMRNKAAREMGFKDYWHLRIKEENCDPDTITHIFDVLEKQTAAPFKKMKEELDGELAARFKINPGEVMPWHYDNPFFQEAPPSPDFNPDDFYKDKKPEELIEIARRFYADIGLPVDDILARSDLYPRDGKYEYPLAHCMDREGTVLVLLNTTPTAESMEAALHELAHTLYEKHLDFSLPFNLRAPSHYLINEGVAMVFGELPRTPPFLVHYAGAGKEKIDGLTQAILKQKQRHKLIQTRWVMVMANFEKELYRNPDQDLNKLWWDMKERFQMVKRPQKRNAPDWAVKVHFSYTPVYYYTYLIGELFSSQVRSVLVKKANHKGPADLLDYSKHKEFGEFFINKIFKPGNKIPWEQLVIQSTGKEFGVDDFVREQTGKEKRK
ncbi:MAG: M2 family metallopeptidase [bacterium]|nr:M2 family metallopeptidase [bacterium]